MCGCLCCVDDVEVIRDWSGRGDMTGRWAKLPDQQRLEPQGQPILEWPRSPVTGGTKVIRDWNGQITVSDTGVAKVTSPTETGAAKVNRDWSSQGQPILEWTRSPVTGGTKVIRHWNGQGNRTRHGSSQSYQPNRDRSGQGQQRLEQPRSTDPGVDKVTSDWRHQGHKALERPR